MSLYSIVRTVIGEKDAALDESSNAEIRRGGTR